MSASSCVGGCEELRTVSFNTEKESPWMGKRSAEDGGRGEEGSKRGWGGWRGWGEGKGGGGRGGGMGVRNKGAGSPFR
jgi:hypothetical protein